MVGKRTHNVEAIYTNKQATNHWLGEKISRSTTFSRSLAYNIDSKPMPTFSDIISFLSGQRTRIPLIPNDVSLRQKTMVITGANTGIGFEAAKHLINLELSHLILACRSIEKGEEARSRILASTSTPAEDAKIEVWQVDLASYESLLAFSKRVHQSPRLDGFIANAGVETPDFELAEGIERTLTVNVVSTFLMSILILPALKATSEKHNTKTNLSFVGSMVHIFGHDSQIQHTSDKDVFQTLSDPKTADMGSRYSLSKLLEHICFLELVPPANHAAPDVVVNLVNPGWCASELSRNREMGVLERLNTHIFQRTAEEGGRTLAHAVTAGLETNGKYLSECRVKEQGSFVRSEKGEEIRRWVWRDLAGRMEGVEPGVMEDAGLT